MGIVARHSGKVAIRVEGLHKSFGENRVLRGIDLDFPVGTTTVILGGSGSGKSVLMKHLIGLLKPDQGRVLVEEQDLALLSSRDLSLFRMRFGMVFQWAALFDSMTVGENVAFPLHEHHREMPEEEVRRRVEARLELFGLGGTQAKSPAELSGGMRKRVGLARATIMEPRIVLYDEPTTGLDPITTESVDDMIIRAKEKLQATSVVISHDVGSAFHVADYIAFLYEGEIVAYGPPAEVRKSPHKFVSEFLATWFART
ncbi:MAG: ABC transporter ATP-binding protein [Myxococcota bacterium]